jgi:hypothetical protein
MGRIVDQGDDRRVGGERLPRGLSIDDGVASEPEASSFGLWKVWGLEQGRRQSLMTVVVQAFKESEPQRARRSQRAKIAKKPFL